MRLPAVQPSRRRTARLGSLRRFGAVCGGTLAVVALGGTHDAIWLALPAALLLATPARSPARAAGAGAAALAAGACGVALAGGDPSSSLPLGAAVAATSVWVARTFRARAEAERDAMRASALTDPLTGVANRRALMDLIHYEVARHARARRRFALVMLDLDGFKAVNDRFGHPAGDELLCDVAAALIGALREQDTLARLGGDEFCILAPETDSTGAERLAARASTAVGRATSALERVSASVGFATFPDDGDDAASMLAAADAAEVDAKRRRYARRAA